MADARIPSASVPAVDGGGRLSQAWFRFFSNLIGPAEAISALTVGPSPFTWAASKAGHVLVSGGTVSSVKIQRGTVMLSVPVGFVPVAQGDSVVVTYTVAPAMVFVPG